MTTAAPVAICIVTHDSAEDIGECLRSIDALEPPAAEIVVVDCASSDGSLAIVTNRLPSGLSARTVALTENLGFAGGMNRAIGESEADWILSLNPDARPESDFLERLLARVAACGQTKLGSVTGRLSRPGTPPRLDACGMRLTRTWRHLDRGSGEIDAQQMLQPERVFGGTGAATLYSREALHDVAIEGEFFLNEFHSYREDAELAFRLRERGWEAIYEPSARALHARRNLPDRRREMPVEINRHSLKNRYLLRAYHQTPQNLATTFLSTLARDLGALLWVVARERSSLAAYSWLLKHRAEIAERRRAIQARRLVPPAVVNRWFRVQSLPL